jgi:hypothetical protein
MDGGPNGAGQRISLCDLAINIALANFHRVGRLHDGG